jgi:hypothetical protein
MEDSEPSVEFIVLVKTADCSSATSVSGVPPKTEEPSSPAMAPQGHLGLPSLYLPWGLG